MPSSRHRYGCELLLAIWPELGDLVCEGAVKLDIVEFPPENVAQAQAQLAVAFDIDRSRLSYGMNLPRWAVRFELRAEANPAPERFVRGVAAARAGT